MELVERNFKEFPIGLNTAVRIFKLKETWRYFMSKETCDEVRDFSNDKYLLPVGDTAEGFVEAFNNYLKFLENVDELFKNKNKEFFYIFEDKYCNKITMPKITLRLFTFDIKYEILSMTEMYNFRENKYIKRVLPFASYFDVADFKTTKNALTTETFKIFRDIGLPIPQKVFFDEDTGKGTIRFSIKHNGKEFKDIFLARFPDSIMDHNKKVISKDFY